MSPRDRRPEVPDEARELLRTVVDSFEKMEVLALAHREVDVVWTTDLAAQRLRLAAESIGAALDELAAAGMLSRRDGGYVFGPAVALQAAATALCDLYDRDRIVVLNLMTSLAMDRIRSSAAAAFADAFRFRRRDPGKGSGR
jgi:hypothetical protein